MKILQVIPYFVPAWDYGGPVQVAYRLCKEMVARGHEVTVYTTDARDGKKRTEKKEELIDGIRVRRFPNLSNALASRVKIFLSPGMLPVIRDGLSRFDLVHLHEYWTLQNVMAHYYAKKFGVPYVLQVHGSLPIMADRQVLKRWYHNLWGKNLLRDAARVIALTGTEAEQYESRGVAKDRIVIIPNGIDLSEFANLPPKGEFREKYGLNSSVRIVLYLGRIHKTKGIGLLVQAFSRLIAEEQDVRLVLVGPDEGYLSELRDIAGKVGIGEKILITGPLYGTAKLEAYVDADVFVTPSFSGFPVTFLEACACGLPIVTTENGDRLDWIDRQAGYVTEYDAGQMGKAIARILHDLPLREKLGKNGMKIVREKFSWTAIAEQVEHVYFGCLRGESSH